ncbi:PucR family transcriptional regulator ligand-binding domain-containing protein [Clostridioides difficile]
MPITVKDVLKLDLFSDSRILAGKNGLNRVVSRVSVFDCPIQIERDKMVLKSGDFFVSNFYPWKDNLDDAIYALSFMDSLNCSCLCITDEYIESFSHELIQHCNNLNFPILTINYSISYGDIMKHIYLLMIEEDKYNILEMQLTNLIKERDSVEIQKITKEINPHLLDNLTIIYCYSNNSDYKFDSNFFRVINSSKTNFTMPYKNGLIIILSYSSSYSSKINSMLNYFINLIKDNVENYVIGISNNFIHISNIQEAISQAILSCTSTKLENNTIIHYKNLGSLSLLLYLKDTPEIKSIYNSVINPVVSYDKRYNKNLLNTLIDFVECGGDYKKTASNMFQHENTIRYRILKIKSILNLEHSNIEFYEQISIGVKLHKIYSQFK